MNIPLGTMFMSTAITKSSGVASFTKTKMSDMSKFLTSPSGTIFTVAKHLIPNIFSKVVLDTPL